MAYNLLNPVTIFSAASMGADATSVVVEVKQQDNVGVQLHWTGTPTGDFLFQISQDYKQDIYGNVVNAGNWITLDVDPAITAAGSGDDAYVDLNQISAPYVRVFYDRTSGTGSLTGYIGAKGV